MIAVFPGITEPLNDERRVELAVRVAQAVRAGRVPKAAMAATFRSSPCSEEVFVSLDLEAGGEAWNPGDQTQIQAVWGEAAATMHALAAELRATHPLFQAMGECRLPAQLGIRESARWRGDYVLTGEDLVRNRRFTDDVALAGWPLEMRGRRAARSSATSTARNPQAYRCAVCSSAGCRACFSRGDACRRIMPRWHRSVSWAPAWLRVRPQAWQRLPLRAVRRARREPVAST